jgi:predicted Zn-ribbon and HTH transcriptional regulator
MTDTHAPCPECGIVVDVSTVFSIERCPECDTDLTDLITEKNES